MPLVKTKGNNYDWITHAHSHLGGECPHKCVYCYVDHFPFGRPKKYQGELRLIEKELSVNYGSGKTIFIENCNDLFAQAVSRNFILVIINHCKEWPGNKYVFQTKNPIRYVEMARELEGLTCSIGCTIETNRRHHISNAPSPEMRLKGMTGWTPEVSKFVTIEPILDFDVEILASWMDRIRPEFVNIGADSKRHNLPEPTGDKVNALIAKLKEYGIEIREKDNLQRLMK